MIKGETGDFLAICDGDGCGVCIEGDHDTFKEFVAWIRTKGWIIVNIAGNWKHYCCRDCSSN